MIDFLQWTLILSSAQHDDTEEQRETDQAAEDKTLIQNILTNDPLVYAFQIFL